MINEPPPSEEQVYEGWFEDRGDASGYSLSVGKFNQNNTLSVNQTMVNPYTYTIFYVTTEPRDDFDPKPADILTATNCLFHLGNKPKFFILFQYNMHILIVVSILTYFVI